MSRILRRLSPFRRSHPAPAPARTPRDLRARLWVSPLEDRSVPATFMVTNAGDNGGVNPAPNAGTGTLRQAVVDANAAAGADLIQFDTAFFATSQTIILAAALPTFTSAGGAITLQGTGARNVIVNGNNAFRPFTLGTIAAGATATFNDMTIANGQSAAAGGGIFVGLSGSLTLNRSTVSGNTSGDSGGGVYFYDGGTFNVTESTFSGNTGGRYGGGGAYFFGAVTATVSNSTFAGNTANVANGGGAFRLQAFASGTLNIRNSTITGNSAVANPGGGISGTSGTVTVFSSIVSGNTGAATGPEISRASGTTNFNFSAASTTTGFTPIGANNQIGQALNLGTLTNNGGPTDTVALGAGSLALNNGSNTAGSFATDQRGVGYTRTFSSGTDIGAFEVQPVGLPSATATSPNVTTPGTSQTVTVVYSDLTGSNNGINVGTLDGADIIVTGPGGTLTGGTFTGSTPPGNGTPRTATYTFTAPGGAWDLADNGTYTIAVVAGQVLDQDGNPVPAGPIGSFTVSLPPANDLVGGAVALPLNIPVSGTTAGANNDYQTTAAAPPYTSTYLTNSTTTALGRDVVYSFTAPAAGTFAFRARSATGATSNMVLYAASTLTPGTVTALEAANRSTTTSNGAEDLLLTLTSGQVVFLVVDAAALTAGDAFTIVAQQFALEGDNTANNVPGTATQLYSSATFGLIGSIATTTDIDYYPLGTLAAGQLVFAMTDTIGGNTGDSSLRLTTDTATLDFDDDGGDIFFGDSLGQNSVMAGAVAAGGPTFLQTIGFNNASTVGLYHLYAVVQPPATSATPEVEANDSIATATTAANNYFSGSMATTADADFYGFGAAAGDRIFIALDGAPGRTTTGFNGVLTLFDGAGNQLLSVNGDGTGALTGTGTGLLATFPNGASEGIIWFAQTAGNYYVRVTTSAGTGNYLLSVSKNGTTGGGGLAPTIGGFTAAPVTINDNQTATPFAAATVSGGTVTVRVTYPAANGAFTNAAGLGFTGTAGDYAFTGAAAAAQTALRNLAFDPADNRVAVGGTESTTFTVNLYSGAVTAPYPAADATNTQTNVVSTSVNDAPGFAAVNAAPQPVNDNATLTPFSTVMVAEPDVGQSVTVTVAYTVSGAAGVLTNLGGFTLVSIGNYQFTGTRAAAQTDLRGLVFNPVPNVLAVGATTDIGFTLSVTDGVVASPTTDSQTTVRITGVNDAPVLGSVNTTPQAVLDTVAIPAFGGVTITDADPGQSVTVTVTYAAAEGFFMNLGGFSGAPGSYTFTGLPADAQTDLRGLTFAPTRNLVAVGATTTTAFTISVNDTVTTVGDSQTTVVAKSVNDAPSFTAGADQFVDEDTAPVTDAWATDVTGGPGAEAGQSVSFLVSNDNNLLFSAQPTISPTGTLTFTVAANAFGSATVTVRLMDGAGTDDGGSDTSAAVTFVITVDAVNDAPSFTGTPPPVSAEDAGAQTVPGFASGFDPGQTNESGQLVFEYEVLNVSDPTLFSSGPEVDASGNLTYTAAADAYGSATFDVRVRDDGGTLDGGVDVSGVQTFTITVTPTNDAPENTDLQNIAVVPNVFTPLTGLSVTEPTDGAAAVGAGYSATVSVPTGEGEFDLTRATTATVTGENTESITFTGTLAEVNDGLAALSFRPTGTGTVAITIESDDGGSGGAGAPLGDTDTFVVAIKQKPVVVAGGGTADFVEGAGPVAVAPALGLSDVDSTILSAAVVRISGGFVAGEDVLAFDAGALPSGVTFTVTADSITFTGEAPLTEYEALLRTVTYANTSNTPDLGARTVSFTVTDELATNLVSDPGARDVTVDDTNDAPVLTIAVGSPVANEDLPVAVPGVSVSDVDAGSGGIRVTVSSLTGTLAATGVGVTIGGSGGATLTIEGPLAAVNTALGNLTFTGAADFFGTVTISVLADDLGSTGGPAETDSGSFPVTVNPVNDAPTFTPGGNVMVSEDSGSTTTPWASNVSFGPANEAPQTVSFLVTTTLSGVFSTAPAIDASGVLSFTVRPDAVGTATVTVRAQDNGGGTNTSAPVTFDIVISPVNDTPSFAVGPDIEVTEDSGPRSFSGWARGISTGPNDEVGQTVTFLVSTTNPTLFATAPAVDANGTLTFTPAADANGTATVTVSVRDSGTPAATSAPQTFTIELISLNDPPRFRISQPGITAGPGTDPVSLADFVTDIETGPADEAGQTVQFEVTNNGEVLFSVQPAISPDGTLTFTPAPFRSGTATVTVRLRDSGGDTFGVDVTPPVQTFTISLSGSNTAPSFNAGPIQVVAEDSAAQTVTGWATNISAGTPSETGQTLTFVVSSGLPSLFAVQPAINPTTGTLTYTPAANAVGTATVTVRLMDSGGTQFGGVDTSAPQTFTIQLTAVNDPPVFTIPGGPVASDPANGARTVSGFATGIAAGPANETGQLVTFQVTTTTGAGLFTAAPAINPTTGTLTFTPAANANGTATVSVRLMDNGGGANLSAPQTFTIVVAPGAQNSPPTAATDAITVAFGSSPTLVPVLANDSFAPDSGETLTVTAVGPAGSGLATLTGGQVFYAPASGFSGTDTFTYTISDGNGGTATGSVTVTVVTPAPGPTPDPDPLPTPRTVVRDLVAIGDQSGSRVRVVNAATGEVKADFLAFPGFQGGVTATLADVTGDGVPDVIVGAGAGGGPVVKVFDGRTFAEVASFHAFLPSLRGGVHVAAGDVNGDGRADLILGAGAGGGPHVKVVDGTRLGERDANDLPTGLLASFFAYANDFLGGVNVAAGDVDGDGKADIVTGAGPGGSPHVKVFDGSSLREVLSVIPYNPLFRGGVNVGAGDLDGDGLAEIITGAGAEGGPHVGIYDGKTAALKNQFFAFADSDTTGVTVAVRPLAAGGATLVAASGAGALKTYTAGVVDDLLDGALFGGITVG